MKADISTLLKPDILTLQRHAKSAFLLVLTVESRLSESLFLLFPVDDGPGEVRGQISLKMAAVSF